uniref:Putative RNA-directed DNA polymerase, eukaryota, Reverse transcriptase zinc-binding domain protein n=1 Tax=Helianthus annuus TaxID=4232 RepID=A0A251UDF3_HELAN
MLNVVNVYAPQSVSAKQLVWNDLSSALEGQSGMWVVGGDFNAVRDPSERRNSRFNNRCATNFNNFIQNSGLIEYDLKGRRFTCIRGNGKKLSKIDRFLVSPDFFNRWPDAVVRALSASYSDHGPIVLSSQVRNFGAKPFRVFNSWLEKDGYKEAVEKSLEDFFFNGPPDLVLNQKLAFIRKGVKLWRDGLRKKEGEASSRALEELEDLESKMEVREISEEEEWAYMENKKVLYDIERGKMLDLRQRARTKWALDGDENSKFFHAHVNARKAVNGIPGLIIGSRWVDKPVQVKLEVLKFFRNRFSEVVVNRPDWVSHGLRQLSDTEKESLVMPFSLSEIKCALKECGDDKAPGPDGFNFKFIKVFWHLFETDFLKVFERFFEDGAFSMGCNSSFIKLIPKIKDPVDLKNYRPINLIGIISKMVSKVLANRLKSVIGSVVSESQSAFLKGNFILDGPLIVNELYNWCKKSKKKVFFLKIDFEKAYDNVNWNFLNSIMEQMGFPSRWCNWIKGSVESARSSVLVNGSPTFEFKCSKGIRQGDPISPFLFILVMEALSYMFDKEKSEGLLVGIQTPRNGPVVSHLFYADDAIIMGEWSRSNITNVVRILRVFHICSGLKINIAKSNLYGVGVSNGDLSDMANIIGCQAEEFPFRYLGLTVGANMNRVVNWKPVYDIFDTRLAKWKAGLLSMGGRITLIKSVLESLPNYFFSLYKAPVQVIKELEAKIRKFLWGGDPSSNKVHWAAWDRVALPVDRGGLGLCKLKTINNSLLSKWGWRFLVDKQKLWVKVIEAVHKTKNRWDCFPVRKSLGGVWGNIINLVDNMVLDNKPLKSFFTGEVGNGRAFQFWIDPWSSLGPLRLRFPALFDLEEKKECLIHERVIIGSGVSRYDWKWRRPLMAGQEVNELIDLCGMLHSLELKDVKDKWLWSGSADNQFSVGTVKAAIIRKIDSAVEWWPSKCKWIPWKCNVFIWRLGLNKLATMDALRKRNMAGDDCYCVLCGEVEETVDHLFISCGFSSTIWALISLWCKIPNIFAFSIKDLLDLHEDVGGSERKRAAIQGIIRIGCWCIWKARNDHKFNNKEIKVEGIIRDIKSFGFFWYSTRSKRNVVSWEDWRSFVNM